MTEFEDHEGNGTAVEGLYAEDNGGRGGEIEDHLDSKSKRDTRDHERELSRSKDREREKGRDKDSDRSKDRDREKSKERSREKDGDRDRERSHRSSRHRDHSRERSVRRERGSRDDDDYRRSRDRDYDRRRDDRGDRRRRRSRSRSNDRSKRRSRSRSPSKSKRVSGFDMAPPASAMLAVGGAVPGLVPPAPPTLPPGMFPNMFPLPTGQPFGVPMMPMQAMTQQATRHARRVYVGGLSPTANEQSVATFFSQVMAAVGGNTAGPGDAVVNVYINHEKKFAFVEMRSVEEASNAMSLDGIIFEGAPVKVRRPSDYNPSLAATLGPSQPSGNLNLAAVGLTPGASGGLEGPDRIFVGGLPYYFTEGQVRELLESFGALKGFDLVKDRETGNSKGYAFCVYQDLSVTDIACAALNGIKMGDKTLTVRRANQGTMQPKPEQESVLLHAQQQIAFQRIMMQPGAAPPPAPAPGPPPTRVVCLTQVVAEDELRDDVEYEDIMEDMRLEGLKFAFCYKESDWRLHKPFLSIFHQRPLFLRSFKKLLTFCCCRCCCLCLILLSSKCLLFNSLNAGALTNVVIPRPSTNGEPVPGLGKVFLKYADTDGSSAARTGMNGRKFGGNEVVAVFYPEDKFDQGDYGMEPEV